MVYYFKYFLYVYVVVVNTFFYLGSMYLYNYYTAILDIIYLTVLIYIHILDLYTRMSTSAVQENKFLTILNLFNKYKKKKIVPSLWVELKYNSFI